MASNGKIPKSQLAPLPISWSNADRQEYLVPTAYASLSRMIARAVADTGMNFQIYDAYRSYDEQVAMLEKNYEPAKPGKSYNTYRTYNGVRYGQKPGCPVTASPGHSNHGEGISIDVHPGPIQDWLRKNGARNGWVNDVPSESWHWSRKNPSQDQYTSEGALDHAWVQGVVGAEIDGKIGTGTVALIKEWQSAHGLEPDGKVGPKTKEAMEAESSSTAPSTPGDEGSPATPPQPGGTEAGFTYTYLREEWDTQGVASSVHPFDHPVKGIYLHYPGSSTSMKGMSEQEIAALLRGYRQTHVHDNGWKDIAYSAAVDSEGRTYQLRGLEMETGANGGTTSNNEAGAILLMVSTKEKPTSKMVAATNALLAQYGAKFGEGYIRGHKESPDASTSCPGSYTMGLIEDGSFSWDGDPDGSADGSDIDDSGLGKVVVDGRLGHDTVEALQRFLNEPEGKPRGGRILDVDGKAGHSTWEALQHYLGTPVDGEVSHQSYKAEELGNGITQGWDYDGPGAAGSTMVEALQRWVGVDDDGIWFEGTTRGLQAKLNQHGNYAD